MPKPRDDRGLPKERGKMGMKTRESMRAPGNGDVTMGTGVHDPRSACYDGEGVATGQGHPAIKPKAYIDDF